MHICRLSDYFFQVGTFNTTGEHYQGHYSIWLSDELDELALALSGVLEDEGNLHQARRVNGRFYQQPTEIPIGVLPIPSTDLAKYGIPRHDSDSAGDQRNTRSSFGFLARLLNTQKPILPVHTRLERSLFGRLMRTHHAFIHQSDRTTWNDATVTWNAWALSNPEIYYKVSPPASHIFSTVLNMFSVATRTAQVPLEQVEG
jgi:hypothetical protein